MKWQWSALRFDWNQVRAFLATAEEGSLSAAARSLGLTQPTLSRQVNALESDLGVTLFERGPTSVELTAAGIELLEHVRAMGDAAIRMSLAASGQAQAVEGHITIATVNAIATYYLPPILALIQEQAPGLEVELIASNEVRDLRRREADISIQYSRPQHSELIGKQIGETTAHLYAARRYLDEVGRPEQLSDLEKLKFIGYEDPESEVSRFNELGASLTRNNFKLSTASGTVHLELIDHGLGAGVVPKDFAERRANLEMVLPSLPSLKLPIWLVTHRELRTSRKVRLVFDLIAEQLMKVRK